MQKNTKGAQTLEGIVSTTGSGIGFVEVEGRDKDIRVEAGFLNTALPGDMVRICLHPTPKGEQQLGEVLEVLKRRTTRFVGVIEKENDTTFLVPDNHRIYTDILIPKPPQNATGGMKALVELATWTTPTKDPTGVVIEVLGPKGEHEVEMRSIVLARGIDTTFPPVVEREADDIKKELGTMTDKEIGARRDFRNTPTFTIDPDDAKDFDDALSFQARTDGEYEIGIHIADVSHYVRPDTTIDQEARQRGFSVYLVDRTIPMLPEVLSNDLCSLNPQEDKLVFSAWFVLDKKAQVKERWFGKGIIHSDKRYTYDDAQKQIESGHGKHAEALTTLNTLAQTLRKEKMRAGAIDFEQDEVKFELAPDGTPIKVWRKTRFEAHKLIEEFMLLANREVAEYIARAHKGKNVPRGFVYRTHDTPDSEKIGELATYLNSLGYKLHVGEDGSVTGAGLNELFKQIENTPSESLIKTAAIRSMQKAAYSTKNVGHFGLAFKYYTHFTSPIRRYADLTVHRLLEKHLMGKEVSRDAFARFARLSGELSAREIEVQAAERDSIKYKQVEYMSKHLGAEFDAIVSGVSEYGIFVQEKETLAEGLVRVRDMRSDFFTLDEKKYRLRGQKTGTTYALGDSVRVKLTRANIDRKQLDFTLV